MQYTIVVFLLLALFGCSADSSHSENVIRNESKNLSLKGKRLQIKDSAALGLRFYFKEGVSTDDGTAYQIASNHDNRNIGFEMIVHNGDDFRLTLKSTGEESDNFLHVLQELYNQQEDTSLHFTEALTADCLPLGGYMDRMARQASTNSGRVMEKKLFFQGKKKEEYAEFYLVINEPKHWIELKEVDPSYREGFIKLLTKKQKRDFRNTKKAGTRELAPGKV